MNKKLGNSQSIFYFNVCGEINTKKTLELAFKRAEELKASKLIIASETGLSAKKAVSIKQETSSTIDLVVVSSAVGTKIENTVIGDLQIGIPDKTIENYLINNDVTLVRGTDPLYNIGAALEKRGFPTMASLIRKTFSMLSSGVSVCVGITLMATDHGVVESGEEIIVVAGSWLGLDTAVVIKATNSVNFFKKGHLEIKEIICKPRTPTHSWPIDDIDWRGDLEPYKKFIVK